MADVMKASRHAARDTKGWKWTDTTENDNTLTYLRGCIPHPKLREVWEENQTYYWWLAARASKKLGGSQLDYIGTIVVHLNRCLHIYGDKIGTIHYALRKSSLGEVWRAFLRHESESRAVNYAGHNSTSDDLRDVHINYAFHEAEFQLYRIPAEDDAWAQEIIQSFDSPEACMEFMTADLNKRDKHVVMEFYRGKSLRQLSDELGQPLGTIQSAKDRALRSIRLKLSRLETWLHLFKDSGQYTKG